MKRTTLRPTMAMTYPLAQGHESSAGKPPSVIRPAANNAASWPAGSIFSNINDLSRFVIAFVNGGKIEDKQALLPAVIAKLSTPYVSTGAQGAQYGYGLEIQDVRGMHVVRHGGSRSGYGSLIWMVPDRRFGVIILANRTGASLSKTAEKAMEIMLPLAPKPPDEAERDLPLSAADKADWPGTYAHASQRAEIVLKGETLFLRRGANDLPIRKTGENRFTASTPGTPRGQQYVVVRGKDGKTLYLLSGGRAMKKL